MAFSDFGDFGRLWRIADVKGGQVCVDRTGISVEALAGRFAAGESVGSIAMDYGVGNVDIEAAIRLVVACTMGRSGLPVAVVRKMEERIPLLTARRGRR